MEGTEHEVVVSRPAASSARILYVATTRARDLLVVPVVGDERREGWLSALAPGVYPADDRRRQPETRNVPQCPSFGLDSVVERPERAPGRERGVAPGLHRPELGNHGVVWWDPHVLRLNVEESVGLRQQRLLEADEAEVASERGIHAHEAWQAERARVRAAAVVPAMTVATASSWAVSAVAGGTAASGTIAASADDVAVESIAAAGARPHGARFGTLVHTVLATVDLDADGAAIARLATLNARLVGASSDERDAATATAAYALTHPLLRRAAAAARQGRCRREVPVALRVDDVLVEGVVDLAFCEDECWTVVDFKTGKLQWKRDDFGAGTILKIGPELLFLTYNGQLYRGIASPTEFKITGQAQVAPFGCRAYPAIATGRLYLRSSNWLFCLDLAKSAG